MGRYEVVYFGAFFSDDREDKYNFTLPEIGMMLMAFGL